MPTKTKFEKLGGWNMVVGVCAVITIAITIYYQQNKFKEQPTVNIQQTAGDNSVQVANSNNVTFNYSNTEDPNYLNPRSDYLSNKDPQELTVLFFELQNQNKYKDACSLLPKKKKNAGCNSINGADVSNFSVQAKKFMNGYENILVVPLSTGEYKQTMCVKYSYVLKSDSNPAQTREYYSYDWEKREDGEREIASRVCEEITKIGRGQVGCLTVNNNKRCYDLLK